MYINNDIIMNHGKACILAIINSIIHLIIHNVIPWSSESYMGMNYVNLIWL